MKYIFIFPLLISSCSLEVKDSSEKILENENNKEISISNPDKRFKYEDLYFRNIFKDSNCRCQIETSTRGKLICFKSICNGNCENFCKNTRKKIHNIHRRCIDFCTRMW